MKSRRQTRYSKPGARVLRVKTGRFHKFSARWPALAKICNPRRIRRIRVPNRLCMG